MDVEQAAQAEKLASSIDALGTDLIEKGDEIYVRAKVDGSWDTVALSSCPPHVVTGFALKWLAERVRTGGRDG